MEHLQDEVLELEFNEFSRGMSTISEHDFARILLRYTDLTDDETDEYLHRLGERVLDSKVHLHFICTFYNLSNDMYCSCLLFAIQGITFAEFCDFGHFLNELEDFALALNLYQFLGTPISEGTPAPN